MNERFDLPFYVPLKMAKRLGFAQPFYLPPLERIAEEGSTKEAYTQENKWTAKQWDAVNQIRAHLLHIEKKLNEHLSKPKRLKEKPKGIVPL